MPSRSLFDLIHYEAAKKPYIAELIERAPEMSDADIDAVKVPLPWYRKALKEVRKRAQDAVRMEITAAEVLKYTRDDVIEDPDGIMYQWQGDDEFVHVDRGGQILLTYGKLIWFPRSGGVWIETAFSQRVDEKLLRRSVPQYETTKTGYTQAYRAKINRECPPDAPVIASNMPDTPAGRLASLGVTISR